MNQINPHLDRYYARRTGEMGVFFIYDRWTLVGDPHAASAIGQDAARRKLEALASNSEKRGAVPPPAFLEGEYWRNKVEQWNKLKSRASN